MKIRIGTRGSKLALWQANWVKGELERHHGIEVELVVIKTKGDKILDAPLAKVGGKGLFVKEIEEALLSGAVDLAVHSMKDVPSEIPPGLAITAVSERETPEDVLVTREPISDLSQLSPTAVVGTSSLRRQAQLLAQVPTLEIKTLRGNLDTRLRKLVEGEYEAVVLAKAGMKRLGVYHDHCCYDLPFSLCLPAVGQGILAMETREGELAGLLSPIHSPATAVEVEAERSFLGSIGGSCQVPVAAFAQASDGVLVLEGFIGMPDGSRWVREKVTGSPASPAELGEELSTQRFTIRWRVSMVRLFRM